MFDPEFIFMGCHCASLQKTDCRDFQSWTRDSKLAVSVHRLSVIFLIRKWFMHHRSCPTVRDWIVVYLALLTFTLQIIIRDREKLKKKMENRDEVIMYNFQFFFQIFVYLFLFFCISSVNAFKYIKSYKYQNQNFSFYQLSG